MPRSKNTGKRKVSRKKRGIASQTQDIVGVAKRVHKVYGLEEPTSREVAAYKRQTRGRSRLDTRLKIDGVVANGIVDGYLDLRSIRVARLRRREEEFARRILSVLKMRGETKIAKAYNPVAWSFARKLARNYPNAIPKTIPPSLRLRLSRLREHLHAEAKRAGTVAWINNLHKYSVAEMEGKLQLLEGHRHKVVRKNAGTILNVALKGRNLDLADKLAKGANAKLGDLKKHRHEVVRKNAGTIVYAALNAGDLGLADDLAKGANAKLGDLKKHDHEVVREYAGTIVGAALNRGRLGLADELARGANATLEALEGHRNKVVREKANVIMYAALNKGDLDLADKLAKGANAKLRALERHRHEVVRENAEAILGAALRRGRLSHADELAKEYAQGKKK